MVLIMQCEWGQGKTVREEGCPKQLILVWDIKVRSLSLFFPEPHHQREYTENSEEFLKLQQNINQNYFFPML